MNKRVLHNGDGTFLGQIRLLWWWITVHRSLRSSDAAKWLGYGEEEEET